MTLKSSLNKIITEELHLFEMAIFLQEKRRIKFKELEKNKVPLTPEERAEVMEKKATWNHDQNGEPTPAVWKSEDKRDGGFIYVTHTHRAFNTAPTLKGAIGRYHKFIKGTA